MAIFDSQKVDYLWKKLGYGRSKTDVNSIKNATNESIASPLLLRGDQVWAESEQIPATIPGTTGGVVTVYPTSNPVECTSDITASANRTWKTSVADWIPPEVGDTYQVKVYVHTSGDAANAASSGTQLFAAGSGNDDEWFFDYQSGVLHFIGTNLPNGVNFSGKSVYVAGARYTGIKGVAPGAGGAGSFNELNVTSLSISGISTFDDAVDINADLDVSGFTELDSVNISGIATATSFVGPLTGNVTGDLTGVASTATKLQTTRDFSASGDATAPAVSFDGTGNVDLVLTLANSGVSASTYGSQTAIPVITVDAKGRITSATTTTVGTALTVAGDSGSEDIDLLNETLSITGGSNVTTSAASNGIEVALDDDISLVNVDATGIVTATAFHTGAEGSAIRITSDTISGPATLTIDPAGVGDNTGTVVIAGDLQVDGTQTIINSTTVTVNDKNIQLADGASNDSAADGSGITVTSGEGNKTFQFQATGDNFTSSENINIASGKVFKIANNEVLSSDQLTINRIVVAGVTTTSGLLDVDGGLAANTAIVEDLTDNRIVIAGVGGELEDDTNLTFDGSTLTVGVDLDVDGLTELDDVNVGAALTVVGIGTFDSDLYVGQNFSVDGHTELDNLNVSGVSTYADVNVGGALSVTGNAFFVGMVTFSGGGDGNIVIGNADTDNVIFNADVNSNFIPQIDGQYDLGSNAKQWRDLYLNGYAHLDDVKVANTLDVVGLSTFASDIDLNASIDVSGNVSAATLNVSGVSTFVGDIDVDGHTELDDVNVGSALTVTGAVDFNGDLDVDGQTELDHTNVGGALTVTGPVTLSDRVDIAGDVEVNHLNVSGISTIGNVVVGGATTDLLVNGDARVTGFLDIGTASIRFDGTNNEIQVGSALTLADNDGIQYYDQSLTQGGLDVNNVNVGTAMTVAGPSDLNGNLDVAGTSELNNVNVSGLTTVSTIEATNVESSNIDVTGSATLNQLNVTGFTTFAGITTFTGDLFVTGNVEVLGSLGGDLNSGGISTFTELVIEGDIDVDGQADFDNIEVTGISTFGGTIDANGNVDVAGTLDVDGQAEFDNVNVSGIATIADVNVSSAITVTGIIDANGGIDVTGQTELDHTNVGGALTVTGNSTFNGNVDILGVLTYEDVTNVDAIGIATARVGLDVLAGGINVTGVSTFNNDLDVTGSIDVDGHTELDNLNVSGVSTFAGTLDANGNVDIAGILDVDGHTELDNVNVSGILTASRFVGELGVLGNTYYVATTGSDSNAGDNINEPYLTIEQALSVATNGDVINVSAGVYEETCPLTVPRGVTIKGAGLRATTIRPTSATNKENVFLLNDISTLEDFTVKGSYYDSNADTGYAFSYATGIAITTRSPYIQRITVLNTGTTVTTDDPYGYDTADSPPTSYLAGRGAKVDGSLVNASSLEAGMLFNEVTFFTPNNKGIILTNGARAEYLNCFHYFASQAIVGIAGTTGIAGTAGARLKLNNPGVTPVVNDIIKLFDGGVGIATGTVTAYSNDYATISGLGIGTFTSVGAGTTQDVRIFSNDGVTLRGYADQITLADYTMFGAEMRSVGCAVEYGAQGVIADGNGVKLRLFATNFNFVGSGKDFTNDLTLTNQANEVVELNDGDVSYVSIDQDGDFRVGDALYINQQTGNVAFAATEYNLEVTGNLDVTDGSNTSTLSPTSLSVGSLTLSGSTLASTSGNIIIDPSGTNKTIVQGDLGVVGVLTASVINVSAFQQGDTSISITDTGSNGAIVFNTENTEAFRLDNVQAAIFSGDAKFNSNVNVSGVSTFTTANITTANVSGLSALTDVTVGSALTVTGPIDANGGLDINGGLSLDNINVSGVSTFVAVNLSGAVATGIITATEFQGTFSGNIGGDLTGNVQAGIVTATSHFDGNLIGNVTGDATGLSGTPNLNVGIITASTGFAGDLYYSDGSGYVLIVGSGIGQTSQLYNTNLYDSLGRPITNVTADQVHFAGVADGLIGDPDISVGVVTATSLEVSGIATANAFAGDLYFEDGSGYVLLVGSGIGQTSQLYNTNLYDSLGRPITNVTADQVHFAGVADGLLGQPDIHVGIVTATNIEVTGVTTSTSFDTTNSRNSSAVFTTSALGLVTAMQISATDYRSVEFLIQATEGSNIHLTKLLAIHDGTTVYLTEYGTVYNNSAIATYDAAISAGQLVLLVSPSSASSTTYKISYTAIEI